MQPLIWGHRVRTSKEYQGLYYSDKTLENRAKPQIKAHHRIRIQHGERAFIHFPPTPQSGLRPSCYPGYDDPRLVPGLGSRLLNQRKFSRDVTNHVFYWVQNT